MEMQYEPVIDFHSHILPGIDDGSKDIPTSMELLRHSADAGVSIMVATPHFYGYRNSVSRFLDRRTAAWEQLAPMLETRFPKILLGAEVTLYDSLLSLDGLDHLCIQGTNTLLLEMPFTRWSRYELDAVTSLCLDRGYQIILAHFERFIPLKQDEGILRGLWELPLSVQVNAESVLGFTTRRRCLQWFQDGRAQLLGSDCHDLKHRPQKLKEARAFLQKKLGPEMLTQIDRAGLPLISPRVESIP